jgi:hypothetical protein
VAAADRPYVMPPESSPESEVTRVAVAFAEALARGDWSGAHQMLAPSLRDDWQAAELKREFGEMTSYWDKPPTEVKLGLADSERAYVAIYSESASYGTVQEAVDVRVVRQDGRWLIDDIVWGRP